jgi:hypothetical protein
VVALAVGGVVVIGLLLIVLLQRPAARDPGAIASPVAAADASALASPATSFPPSPSASTPPNGTPGPSSSAGSTAPPPATGAASLPVRRDAGEIVMAAGPDRGLYVSIPDEETHVLALVGADGNVRPGWPIRVSSSWCPSIASGDDGSVRLICAPPDQGDVGLQEPTVRIFGFDAGGRSMAGWPVDVPGEPWGFAARMVGPDLAVLIDLYMGDAPPEGAPEEIQLGLIDSGGALRTGSVLQYDCCESDSAIGPDGTGYVVQHDWPEGKPRGVIVAFRLEGLFPSWPVTIDSGVSSLGFDDEGRIYAAVADPGASVSRTVVMDRIGQVLPSSAADLPIGLTSSWSGAGDSHPAAPIVGANGTAFIVAESGGTQILAVDERGSLLPGWPYGSSAGVEDAGRCNDTDTGCGFFRVEPVVDHADVLYVAQSATSSSAGGRLIALTDRGQVVDGWPVGLKRPGAYFFSILPAPGGGIWALAREPERNGSSATVLSIGPDSTVRWTMTIADP